MSQQFQVDLRGLIELLSDHLYSGPEVYVRELLQNAIDAITARTQLDPTHVGDVLLECHAPKGKPPALCVTDNGIGLTAAEVHKFLATIGLSSKKGGTGFIGRFGIGTLSGFVVSDEIVVVSRSAREADAKPVEWRAKADGTYTVRELDRDIEPGTQVWLTAKPGSEELFDADRVADLAKQYGNLLPYPIRLAKGKGVRVINEGGAPWRDRYPTDTARTKALLAYGKEVFGVKFFDAVPLRASAGKVEGVAFILPHAAAAGGKRPHRLYLKNMFLTEQADALLPDWAFFVQVVANADDLRPTASREGLHEDAKLTRARDAVGDALRGWLLNLAETRPERLEQFLGVHHRAVKALAVEDDEFFRLVIDWLPFESSLGRMSFGDFRKAANRRVRYVADVDGFRQVAGVAAAQDQPLLNAGYAYDGELMARAAELLEDLDVAAVDPTDLAREFDDLDPDEQDAADRFLDAATAALKAFRCGVEGKRFKPADLPALYSTSSDGRFLRSLEQSKEKADPLWAGVLGQLGRREKTAGPAASLCLNFANPLVRKLAAAPRTDRLTRAVQMLYVQALLLGHHPLSAAELAVLNRGLLALIDDAVS